MEIYEEVARMTENKFGVITNWCIYENVDGVKKWLNFDEVVDLLNELSEENDELRKELNCEKPLFTKKRLHQQNQELTEENKQLKQFQEQVAEVIENKMEDNVCNDYKMEVLKEIWDELELDEVWFE